MPDWRTAKPMSPYHKGEGNVTDDTLMTHLLVAVYAKNRRHLTAFDMADDLVPLMMNDVTWIPELERETVPLLRVFLAEKWLVTRLHYGHVDPREAGVGNIVNCGAAMYMAPVGIANAGDAARRLRRGDRGRRELISPATAARPQRSSPPPWPPPWLRTPRSTACWPRRRHRPRRHSNRDRGLRRCGGGRHRLARAIPLLRTAVTPYDSVGETYREPAQDSRRPSRLRSIEELPVALGLLKATGGDARGTILGATNYGRDSDSIATMGGALAGALGGETAIPTDWAETVGTASRLDLRAGGRTMAAVAAEIFAADETAWLQRHEAFGGLLEDRSGA